MKTTSMRRGFSMITAIFLILLMATVGAFVMSLGGKLIKSTTIQYQREQAMLYAKSYTEYAVMAVTAHDRSVNCLTTINGLIGNINNGGYSIRTNIAYIGSASGIGTCVALNINAVTTPKTPLTIIVDVYVDYKDPDNNTQTLTVHRRSVQKI